MESTSSFIQDIEEIIEANNWIGQLEIEPLPPSSRVRIRISSSHPFFPSEIVNDYSPEENPLEQLQQDCLRALRTGSSGI